MSNVRCVIQEHGAAERSTNALEARLRDHHAAHYPGEHVTVSWRTVPEGFMFTEGRQSTSSIISCEIGHRTTRDDREAYMRGVCDLWSDVTGCTDHEIVVAITEPPAGS